MSRVFHRNLRERLWKKRSASSVWMPCEICGKPMFKDEATLDHIYPRSKGGRNYADNLQLVHKECNEKKGDAVV